MKNGAVDFENSKRDITTRTAWNAYTQTLLLVALAGTLTLALDYAESKLKKGAIPQ
jgi:hypothetical protein